MAKKSPEDLAPHGTFAAALRHTRNGDPLCDPCIEARRVHRRKQAARQQRAKLGLAPLDEDPTDTTKDDDMPDTEATTFRLPSELEETRSNFEAVHSAMSSPATPATALASLSTRRQTLYERLVILEEREEHRRIVAEAVARGDSKLAADAVRDAGGSPLDVILARSSASRKPIAKVADRIEDDDEA